MNAIIIIIDALRFSNVGCYGYDKDTTPNIDELASRSLVFDNCFAQANYTDISLTTILSGKHPLNHGVLYHGFSSTKENMAGLSRSKTIFMQEILQHAGYQTIAIDWLGRWHKRGFNYYYGIDEKQNTAMKEKLKGIAVKLLMRYPALRKAYSRYKGASAGRDDCEKVTEGTISQINKAAGNNFFAFVHYWDVHPPYSPPEEHAALFPHDEDDLPLSDIFKEGMKEQAGGEYAAFQAGKHITLNDAKRDYDGAIHWVDSQIGRLIEHLESKGLMDQTIMVITADHGHNFGEHDIYFDNASLYDTSTKVPLVIWYPGQTGARISGLVQHTDLMPTVLSFLGIETPTDIDGNVLPDKTREEVVAEAHGSRFRMIRTFEWKYIEPVEILNNIPENVRTWYKGNGKPELYNVIDDPGELHNLADANPDVCAMLKERLIRRIHRSDSRQDIKRKLKKIKAK